MTIQVSKYLLGEKNASLYLLILSQLRKTKTKTTKNKTNPAPKCSIDSSASFAGVRNAAARWPTLRHGSQDEQL